MTRKSTTCAAVCFALVCALSPERATAQFAVCNQTLEVINVSSGSYERDVLNTSGWWIVGPNQCANVEEDTLTSRFFYVYAQDVFGKELLTGSTLLCVAPGKFRIRGQQDCLVRGYLEARYKEVDTRRSERWTLFVYPSEQ